MKAYFDTNVLVAACVQGHVHHARAIAALRRCLPGGDLQGHLSTHAIAEIYGVLTRTPFLPRVLPHQAELFLTQNILPNFQVVEFSRGDYLSVLEACSLSSWTGGAFYDCLHLRAARNSGCEILFTFDTAGFQRLAGGWASHIAAP